MAMFLRMLMLGLVMIFALTGPAFGLVAFAAGWPVLRGLAVAGAVSWCVAAVTAFLIAIEKG